VLFFEPPRHQGWGAPPAAGAPASTRAESR
jgi:hypothetical protein